MAEETKRKKWSDVKARLEAFDRKGLVSLLGERDRRAVDADETFAVVMDEGKEIGPITSRRLRGAWTCATTSAPATTHTVTQMAEAIRRSEPIEKSSGAVDYRCTALFVRPSITVTLSLRRLAT
jgi:hypothetical protein